MSNSALVSYTRLSPNHSGKRNHAIDTITIHCVAGHASLETLGNIFAPTSRQASSQYGVDDKGNIGQYCLEENRSWCSSSPSNDHRAVTIEVASDVSGDCAVTDAALAGTIKLVADICKRNGIKKLLWKADKSLIGQVDKQNMTAHRWFAAKSCPGNYLYSRMGYIADKVNELIAAPASATPVTPAKPATPAPSAPVGGSVETAARDVIAGKYGNGDARKRALKAAGFDPVAVQARVNEILTGKAPAAPTTPAPSAPSGGKSIDAIAREVIAGKWGNNPTRKAKLIAAGYDAAAVQARVNALLK
jgi:hypothetical protein